MLIEDGSLPRIYDSYVKNAAFVDQVEPSALKGRDLFLGVCDAGSSHRWPEIVITQRYEDASGTFHPGFLVVPETSILFIGAGERLLGYNVERREKVFEDRTDYGFWGWTRHEDYILMAAELEFGVWRKTGEKLWSAFVEPPWSFNVSGETVELDIMGQLKTFSLETGAVALTNVS
ncbi:hypothetical protein [Rhizobium leguminosarum]|uniref:Uncharacterized protein n=1 Tax=Rhizobium leguminosarum TaxID=384 RepID=A0A7M3DW66_RHILE|nr:hypothetical protein [Rhizobium leguminosarum]TAY52907.1 hypothetical protein ELH90_15345 [Rhizobium leguminosarum]